MTVREALGRMPGITPAQRDDPDVHAFIERARQADAEEKVSDPDDWTPDQRASWARGDWREFSRLRGYTDAEIANFDEYLRLAYLMIDRYGEEFAWSITIALHEGEL